MTVLRNLCAIAVLVVSAGLGPSLLAQTGNAGPSGRVDRSARCRRSPDHD